MNDFYDEILNYEIMRCYLNLKNTTNTIIIIFFFCDHLEARTDLRKWMREFQSLCVGARVQHEIGNDCAHAVRNDQ